MSDLILYANGGRFGGDRALRESERGRVFVLGVFTGEAETACWRWTQARAACRRVPFLGGGSEGAAKAALCSTER